jgi:hypothetical protein
VFRALVIIVVIALFYGATPLVGRWVTTASASTTPLTSRPEALNGPAAQDNDNLAEECSSSNPRKQKKCNYDGGTPYQNDNGDNGGGTPAPVGGISVSNANPGDGETVSFTVNVSGNDLNQVWWWVTGYSADDNDNDSSLTDGSTHFADCNGQSTCSQTATIPTGAPGTLTIHAVANDHEGRQTGEMQANVYVHD